MGQIQGLGWGESPLTSSLPASWWGYHWSQPRPLSIVELIRAGSLDAELAALLWVWLEARLPVLVAAGPPLAGKSTTLAALLDFLPSDTRRVYLRGDDEDFGWLPEAASLGWQAPGVRRLGVSAEPGAQEMGLAIPGETYILVNELSSHLPIYTWGEQARTAIRAASHGYGLGATLHATSLEQVLDQLEAPPVRATDDEVRALGIVLILGPGEPRSSGQPWAFDGSEAAPTGPRRVVAAHYLRPIERDQGGHLQRRPPAVLATWDRRRDAFDHFAWGFVDELASRAGRSVADFQRERERRAAFLTRLVDSDVSGLELVSQAIDQFATGRRAASPLRRPVHTHGAPVPARNE